MATIITRQTTAASITPANAGVTNKGAPLTNAELDTNLIQLNYGITSNAAITGGTIGGITALGLGAAIATGYNFRMAKSFTGGTSAYGVTSEGAVQSDVTGGATAFLSQLNTQATAFTLGSFSHFQAGGGTVGAGSTVTAQTAFNVTSTLTGATQNNGLKLDNFSSTTGKSSYGIISGLNTNTGTNFNIYSSGTAPNYFAGSVGIGTTSPAVILDVSFAGSNGINCGNFTAAATSNTSAIQSFGSRNDGNQTFQGKFGAAFRRSDATAITSATNIGMYAFGGQWGVDTSYQSAKLLYPASIKGVAEGSFTSDTAMPTAITFNTGSIGDAIGSPNLTYGTERMRITSAGGISFGATGTAYGSLGQVLTSAGNAPPTWSPLPISSQWTTTSSDIYYTTGNVGIGTASPRFKLSVGSLSASSSATPDTIDLGATFSSTAGANPKFRMYWDGTTSYGFGISNLALDYIVPASASHVWYGAGSERMRIDSSGNVGIGTTTPSSYGKFAVVGTAGQLFTVTDSLTGTIFSANDVSGIPSIEVLDTGVVKLAQYSGNVGIGTASPAYKLDVTGTAKISSTLIVGGTPPAAGQLSVVGANAGISLALSDNINSSVYFRHLSGGSLIGTDGGNALKFATGGNTDVQERMRISAAGGVSIGNTTDPGAGNLSVTGGTVSLTNGTSNLISYGAIGVNLPTFTTRSTGTKIVLFPALSASNSDYAIGIDSNTLWFSVDQVSTRQFKWYAGTTLAATLTGGGALTTVSTISDNKGDVRAAPINSQGGAYVAAASDAGKTIYISTGGVTINASVFNAGDMVTIVNNSASAQTITAGASVTFRLAGTGSTGNRTLAQYGMATYLCVVGGATPTFHCSGAGLT